MVVDRRLFGRLHSILHRVDRKPDNYCQTQNSKKHLDHENGNRKTSSTTAMLISVSVIFLSFNVPMDVHILGYSYGVFPDNNAEQDAVYNLAFAGVSMLYYANNAVEFALYFISGSKFRRAFFQMMKCRRRNLVEPTAAMTRNNPEIDSKW